MSYNTHLRFKMFRYWQDFATSLYHNLRVDNIQNGDPTLLENNMLLIGSIDDTVEEIAMLRYNVDTLLEDNLVIAFEVTVSATLDYFLDHEIKDSVEFDQSRLYRWLFAVHDWSMAVFGNKIVNSVLHLDEFAPHIHLSIVPAD
ncbi:MAG: plasmid recombination protein, partial [Clostridiales Family XIII bacterium]|nr:plasmid recombination protein [Clostridiales Family XIII bacterium]